MPPNSHFQNNVIVLSSWRSAFSLSIFSTSRSILLKCKAPYISSNKSFICFPYEEEIEFVVVVDFFYYLLLWIEKGVPLRQRTLMKRGHNIVEVMSKEKVVSNSTLLSSSIRGFNDKGIANNNMPSWLLTSISGMCIKFTPTVPHN